MRCRVGCRVGVGLTFVCFCKHHDS
jgi:hypothetical protein